MAERTQTLVCFDYEGRWGMPFAAPYDIGAATRSILECLADHRATAVFFVVGELTREHPQLIRAIADGGHEIGLHGHRHEDLARLSDAELEDFGRGLRVDEDAVEQLTGRRPAGFRAPYLLAPRFFDARVYALLREHGYRWVSNCELRHPVELARPGLPGSSRTGAALRGRPAALHGAVGRSVGALLNARLLAGDPPRGSVAGAVGWMASGCPPFSREGLVEIPVSGPLDCDVIGLPDPGRPSTGAELDFAVFAMAQALADRGGVAMLTFHDWIVGGANRIAMLDRLLSVVSKRGLTTVRGDAV
jgi:peptidoglycan/xylan/chitin deacetylase (PgdA/CDA1 family)